MKKILFVLVTLLIISLLGACSDDIVTEEGHRPEDSEEIYLISKTVLPITFKEAVKDSDIIVEIEVSKIIGDLNDDVLPRSVIEGKILEVYKGNKEIGDTVLFLQVGNSKYIDEASELYSSGERLILFLNLAEGIDEYEELYWIRGDETTTFVVDTISGTEMVFKEVGNYFELKEYEINDIVSKYDRATRSNQVFTKEIFKQLILEEVVNYEN